MISADQAAESQKVMIRGVSKRKIRVVPAGLSTIPERRPLRSRTGRAVNLRARISAWASMSRSFSKQWTGSGVITV